MPEKPKYHSVHSKWPDVLPALDGDEAVSAAKRIYRKFRGRPWRGRWKVTSGNRYTYAPRGTFFVNPNRTDMAPGHEPGWPDLAHMMSHAIFRELKPHLRPHDRRHEYLERDITNYIIEQGWLDGKLKRKPKAAPKPVTEVRYAAVLTKLAKWNTKLKRAQTAIRKLQKQKRYYERKTAQ